MGNKFNTDSINVNLFKKKFSMQFQMLAQCKESAEGKEAVRPRNLVNSK